ncbi:hypothetical protein M405DRAFT_186124 [Rhizopogon salebrosus TDB-379]|nr:hypothetical protein M405DRAFT_186124 [Rhizopogon salebrosus TDB-379]
MQRAMPQWRIENDIKVPNISISNPVPGLFSRPPPSTIVSSTRAAPPTSPAPIPGRRRPTSPPSQVTSSRTNTLTREVLPGASPAFIPTADNPASFDLDSYSHRTSLLSNSSGIDSSRHDPILIPDEVHIVIPSHSQEQGQVQDPELSALDILPPIAAVEVTTANVEIVSPTPLMSIQVLPIIPDIDLSIPAHQVSLPPSRPASRVDTTGVTGISQGRVRTLVEKFGSDQGPDFGKPYMSQQRASSTGVLGQGQNHSVDTRPGSTGHQRSDLSSRRREGSMLRPIDGNWRRGVILDGERTTEHTLSDSPGTETFIGGFFIRDRQTPQRSGTPREQSGSGGAPPGSALGLDKTFSPSKAPVPPPKPRSTSVPLIKPPTPGPQTRLTTPAPHTKSDKAESRSKTPIPVPPSKSTTPKPPSKSTTPIPKSDRATPDPTSSTHRATDYNPAEPVRPMPGLKSPSTEPDSIFGGPRLHAYASGNYDTNEYDMDDVPPPKYESPVNTQGEGLGETSGRQEEVAEDGAQQVVTGDNTGEAGGIDVQEAGDGTQGGGETSQGAGEHTQGGGQNTTRLLENASEKMGNNQEQEVNKPEEKKVDQGGGDDNQGAVNDSQVTDNVTQVADEPETTSVAGGHTEGADGHTEVNQSSKPEPTLRTPAQKEAEIHRTAFLRKEVTRLEASKLVSGEVGLPGIQARVDALKERIVRTNFTGAFVFSSTLTDAYPE